MSFTSTTDSTYLPDASSNPFNNPSYQDIGSRPGTVFLTSNHLDVVMQLPLPGIVIFVHGVNSDGEWYKQAEEGLCEGLNERLKRCEEHICHATPAGGKLTSVQYFPELTHDGFVNPKMGSKTFIQPAENFSPVIQFRWGYKASAEELQKYSDGIYLNEHRYWGGGPFANGCTSLPDLWGAGLTSRLFLWMHVQHLNPTPDRKVYSCPPRPYFVLAALRLAKLVESIRKKQADVPITIVCHSQGNMIGMAAAFLGDRLAPATDPKGHSGRCVADNYVLCNPPYSLVEKNFSQAWTERDMEDAKGNNGRQSKEARYGTLRAFFEIIGQQAAAQQSPAIIDAAMKNEVHKFDTNTDRKSYGYGPAKSTQGRVTLYFNPHDKVISTTTIQGIGWRGLSEDEIKDTGGAGIFTQRVFSQNFDVGKTGIYDFWANHHKDPEAGSKDFWFPHSQNARYSLSKGLEASTTAPGTILTFAVAPILILATSIYKEPINALPPKDWKTPLSGPNLPKSFKPQAIRFGKICKQFDQGMDAPGEYRAQNQERDESSPYAGDRTMPKHATEEARLKGTDAAEGNTETEAALLYEHRAMLRMEAKREGLYKKSDDVEMENDPLKADAKYNKWRTRKIKDSLAASIDTHATDHSTIMTNSEHARMALAYDVAIGVCNIKQEDFTELRIAADWRFLKGLSDNDSNPLFHDYFNRGLVGELSVCKWSESGEGGMPSKIKDERKLFF